MEYNLAWIEGLDKVLRWLAAHAGMWPAIAFRMLAITEDEIPSRLQVLAAHYQGSATPQATRSKVTLQAPLVIEGVITTNEFITLLRNWTNGQAGTVDHWLVAPPKAVTNFWWQTDVPVAPEHFPLIEELPALPTRYREARLSGSGEQIEPKVRTWLQERLFDLGSSSAHGAVFANDYLSLAWGMDTTHLLIHLPLAVGMSATFESDPGLLVVETHFRPPISPLDLEIRVGSGLFDASLEVHTPLPLGTDKNGWDLAKAEIPEPRGGAAKVWLTRRGMEAAFGWELTVDLGRAVTPEYKREKFIADWYVYARKDFAQEVEVRMPGGGKGDRPGDALELALANACGALGYGVFFAGHLLQSAGVDLVAFDLVSKFAYVISATVGNDIVEKLRTWLAMEPAISQALMPEWIPRPVIITSQPGATLVTQDVLACYARRVLVLSAENLAALKESPPDIQMFGRTLAQDPPGLPTPRSRFV